ncbi:hypothetical protein L7F22_044542 [Adiantum nelumboides]|nr:hypothetical protein [Adiantum nelumboides]
MPSKPGNSRRSSSMATSLSAVDQTPQPHVSVDGLGGASGANPEDAKYLIANRFLATLLQEIVIDTALYAIRSQRGRKSVGALLKEAAPSVAPGEKKRNLRGSERPAAHVRMCPVCSCQAEHHAQSAPAATSSANAGSGTEGTAANGASGEAASATATPQPKGLDIYHNNPLLACLVCSRQVSANRYAQHLASCVGVGKGGIARRKGKAGGAAKDRSKVKSALEARKRAGLSQSNGNGSRMGTPTPTPTATSDDEGGTEKSSESLRPCCPVLLLPPSDSPSCQGLLRTRWACTTLRALAPLTLRLRLLRLSSCSAKCGGQLVSALTASPLNPNRYQSNTNAALAGSLKGKGSTGKEKKRKREDNEDEDGEDEDGEEPDDDEEDDDDGADDADDDDDDEEEDDDDDESEADSDGNVSSPDVPLGSSRPNDGLAKASTGLPLSQSGIERSKEATASTLDKKAGWEKKGNKRWETLSSTLCEAASIADPPQRFAACASDPRLFIMGGGTESRDEIETVVQQHRDDGEARDEVRPDGLERVRSNKSIPIGSLDPRGTASLTRQLTAQSKVTTTYDADGDDVEKDTRPATADPFDEAGRFDLETFLTQILQRRDEGGHGSRSMGLAFQDYTVTGIGAGVGLSKSIGDVLTEPLRIGSTLRAMRYPPSRRSFTVSRATSSRARCSWCWEGREADALRCLNPWPATETASGPSRAPCPTKALITP